MVETHGEAGSTRETTPSGPDTSDLTTRLSARAILVVALLCYSGVTVNNLFGAHLSRAALAICVVCQLVIFFLQLRHSSPGAARAPLRQKCLTLGTQALLTYLPITLFHSIWGSMAGFLAGSLLLLLPGWLAWATYGFVGLTMVIPPAIDHLSTQDSVYLLQSTLLTGLVVYSLSRLAALVQALHEARGQLADMAVTRERLRFARDLHDLLGYSLSAITLKTELIQRLVTTNPRRALDEVGDVLEISRESLADVRAISNGLRHMSLKQELGSAQSLLEAAGLRVQVEADTEELELPVDSVLATVLREAVTNLLRHSHATFCTVQVAREAGLIRLTVTNDGADPAYRDTSAHSGSGLGNLRERLLVQSGTLNVELGADGTFRLIAEAPARGRLKSVGRDERGESAA
ncbi:sensor histidine kinase [Kitasatospora sp. NPDC087314]|uniref:sensor histidine kinase n=1 Tax=Kitasatospora sp. NPDC087314 TaxID=3364068 RepID=UPI0038224C03